MSIMERPGSVQRWAAMLRELAAEIATANT
jgi:hypothetical protein